MTGVEMKIPTPAELEEILNAGSVTRLGSGSRRICERINGTELCVKFYRTEEEIDTQHWPDGTTDPIKDSVKREIRAARFDAKRNTNCLEARYYRGLRKHLPAELMGVFPDVLELVYLPSRGWSIVENVILNSDGTQPERFVDAYRRASAREREMLLGDYRGLAAQLETHNVSFYDPPNIVVQRTVDGDFRLRIVDFEPKSRTLLPIDKIFPCLLRRKVNRRMRRYLKDHLRIDSSKILRGRVRTYWDHVIATEGAKIGLTKCHAFLEAKQVNDVFYRGVYFGRPCVVKCSSIAPKSLQNEFERSKELFHVDQLSCAEPLTFWMSADEKSAFVVTEELQGPSLWDAYSSGKIDEEASERAAEDLQRLAMTLQQVRIVHRDLMPTNLILSDGHYRMIDLQFAVNRQSLVVDPYLRRHPKYHFAVFGCGVKSRGVWNDCSALVAKIGFLCETKKSYSVRRSLEEMLPSADFKITPSWRDALILNLYRLSLSIQKFFARKEKRDRISARLRKVIPL